MYQKLQCLQLVLVNRKDPVLLHDNVWPKVEWFGLQNVTSYTIFTWPFANKLSLLQASWQLFVGKTFLQPARGRKCFPSIHQIPKHGLLCYRKKNKFISLWQNVLIVIVPVLINKDVVEPSYNDLKFTSETVITLFSSVQSLSHVQLFATPWTAARQASLSNINSQSLLKLMSVELVMTSNHPSSVVNFSSCLQSFPASGSFLTSQFFASDGQSIEASASASDLPVNIQGWFPLGLTDLTVFFNVDHLYSHLLSFLMLIFLKNMVL